MIRADNHHPHRKRYVIGGSVISESDGNEDKDSCDLTKVRMIDFEKFAYGPPGIDIGQFMANYIYFMPAATWLPNTEWKQDTLINLRADELFVQFEAALRGMWVSYIEAFDLHLVIQEKEHGIKLLKNTKNGIIQENLQDAIGFIGWWIFSLVASCPVDVMPVLRPLARATEQRTPLSIPLIRMLQLKIAYAALKRFHSKKKFDITVDPTAWIEDILIFIKGEIFSNGI